MKFRISLFLLTLALAASSALAAQAGACSNMTIKGTYATTIHGLIFLPDGSAPLTLTGIGMDTHDGNGNAKGVDAVGVNGNVAPGWHPSTGTYSVDRTALVQGPRKATRHARPAHTVYRRSGKHDPLCDRSDWRRGASVYTSKCGLWKGPTSNFYV